MADKKPTGQSDKVSFFLNGEKITLDAPSPKTMLIDFLRAPEQGLSGPKKPCGQGGCGGCTVVLSSKEDGKVVHRSINSCLRPVTALNWLSVTTIEGTGSVDGEMNRVAYELAKNNGTQCGYCTNGWVMCMSGYLANKKKDKPTQREIENLFDGNICRCTGYRAILTGMKQFASDKPKLPMKTEVDPAFAPKKVRKDFDIPVPRGAFHLGPAVRIEAEGDTWVEAKSAAEVGELARKMRKTGPVRLVHGNTSFGVYKDEIEACHQFIDIRAVKELRGVEEKANSLTIGAGVTYSELLDALAKVKPDASHPLGILQFMARRTAGHIVRNAASIGGNTMLVLKHIHQGAPFPSDLATALLGVEARVTYLRLSKGGRSVTEPLADLVEKCVKDRALAEDLFLLRYHVKTKSNAVHWVQKVALREVNSHSIVNMATRFVGPKTVKGGVEYKVSAVIGGILTSPLRIDEVVRVSKEDSLAGAEEVAAKLRVHLLKLAEAEERRKRYLKDLPDEGFDASYRADLASKLFYKACLNTLNQKEPALVPPDQASGGERKWGKWPVSHGTMDWEVDNGLGPLAKPFIKLMAMYQAQGEVRYTHETPMPARALFGAVVATTRATGRFHMVLKKGGPKVSFDRLIRHLKEREPGFADLITTEDIPAGRPGQKPGFGMAGDQPLFVAPGDEVMYGGQAIAMVLANSQEAAERIAEHLQTECVKYAANSKAPVMTIKEALKKDWLFPDSPAMAPFVNHIWKVKRPDSSMGWTDAAIRPTKANPFGLGEAVVKDNGGKKTPVKVIEASQDCGGQLHFYMETQAAIAEPQDGNTMLILSSTQSPKTVHNAVVKALGVSQNQVRVEVPQVGGAYGGKTEPSQLAAAMAAVGAAKTGRPVMLALVRDTDSAMIGGRHPYHGDYHLALDDGSQDPDQKGRILGVSGGMVGDGGAYYDCSFVVSDCIQLRVDNAYNVPNYETTIDVARTNTAPNTAYRAFGDIQGTLMFENAIEEAAAAMEIDPALVRERSLYKLGDTVPSGQRLEYCYQKEVWDYAKAKSDYDRRRRDVEDFNAKNKWRKRGICLMPLKYGSGFNLIMLEQTTALVSIYPADGTILIQQGGADMGQGMVTQLAQIAAYELDVPLEMVRVAQADTSVIANPSSTGASTGTQYNGLAIKNACDMLKTRLQFFCSNARDKKGNQWCQANNIDYWDSPKRSWKAKVPGSGKTYWQHIVSAAFDERVNLQAQAKAVVPGGTKPITTDYIAFKPRSKQPKGTGIAIAKNGAFSEPVNEYVGFTYNAACAEVEVDVLTGETKVLRADIVHDMGHSLNPAIDIGQIEGAFVQGMGYVLTEEKVFQPEGAHAGMLNTVNTWRYKPPAVPTIPLEMHTHIFPRSLASNVPEDPNALYSSKEVGEPPMVLANTVFFAVKSAVRAARVERGLPPKFDMPSPATVQTVHEACWKKPGRGGKTDWIDI